MEITASLPLLFALGARIALNSLVFPSTNELPSTPDFLLTGLFQGVLLYHTATQLSQLLVIPIAFGIAVKLVIDFSRTFDTTQCVCTLLGVALGVVFTDVLSRVFEDGSYKVPEKVGAMSSGTHARDAHDTSKRLRLVSFSRVQDRTRTHGHRRENGHAHRRDSDERERDRDRDRERNPRRLEVRPITPTLTYASTAPSISLDSVPSSIDPEGRLTPHERAVAVLRARASLADSERRRFKEERKWALSEGNFARASQLAWQVRRYAALMESFHREADAKVVQAARAAAPPPGPAPPVSSSRIRRTSGTRQHPAGPSNKSSTPFPATVPALTERPPLVSVTVGTAPRHRKRSSGSAALRPAIRVQGREINAAKQ